MITKKTLYPKTQRLGKEKVYIEITEKLDGSNLGIGKLDGELFVATRNNIFKAKDYNDPKVKQIMYKGLHPWLEANAAELENSLHEGSIIFGEWIAMGRIVYPNEMKHNFYMFSKANIASFEEEVTNLYYKRELLAYPFVDQVIPECIRLVPQLKIDFEYQGNPRELTIEEMDIIYDRYLEEVGRPVEGFIMNVNNNIKKYVRNKGGKIEPHRVHY